MPGGCSVAETSPPLPHTPASLMKTAFMLTGTQPGPIRPSKAAVARLDSITPASRVVGMSRRDGFLLSGPNPWTNGDPEIQLHLHSYRWNTSLEPRGSEEANDGPLAKLNCSDCQRDCADWPKPV